MIYFLLFSIIANKNNADKKLYLQLFQERFPVVFQPFHHAQVGHPILDLLQTVKNNYGIIKYSWEPWDAEPEQVTSLELIKLF